MSFFLHGARLLLTKVKSYKPNVCHVKRAGRYGVLFSPLEIPDSRQVLFIGFSILGRKVRCDMTEINRHLQ